MRRLITNLLLALLCLASPLFGAGHAHGYLL